MALYHDPALPPDLLPMSLVPGGSFAIGSPDDDADAFDDKKGGPRITLPDFYIGVYPVTQDLWALVLDGDDPSHFKGVRRPVEQVSWLDIVERFLPALQNLTGRDYRLPTEAEWEYAAKGGPHSEGYRYAGSDKLREVGWYSENSGNETHEVGLLYPNELGLYDMSGNVYEWVADTWVDNYRDMPKDGRARDSEDKGARRVIRGGNWVSGPRGCRSAYRYHSAPGYRADYLGFRLAFSPR